MSENGSYHFLLPVLEGSGGGITKFEKFAWFYKVSGKWSGRMGESLRRMGRSKRSGVHLKVGLERDARTGKGINYYTGVQAEDCLNLKVNG